MIPELIAAAVDGTDPVPIVFRSRERAVARLLGDLLKDARRVATALRDLGATVGTRIAVQLPNGEEQFLAQMAAAMIGAVFVPVVPVFGAAELARMLSDAHPEILITRDRWRRVDYLANWAQVPAGLRPGRLVVAGLAVPPGAVAFPELLEAGAAEEFHTPHPEDDCLVIYSSGSTGRPKGVRHTHRSVLSEAREPHYLPVAGDGGPQQLQATGAGHIGGFLYPLRIMMWGTRMLVLDWWDTRLAVRAIAEHRISTFQGTPFHLAAILDTAEAEGIDLTCLGRVVVGGAPTDPHLIERADAAGVVAVRGYGLSEHPTVTVGDFDAPLEERAGSEGRASGGNEVRIADDRGRPLPAGTVGEVQTRGPDLFKGYTDVPDDVPFTPDGWLRTGDLGRLDERGHLTIVDRKKNIIIRGGENLSIAEIELAVARHPQIAETAVVGIPDDRYGERVCAFIVPRGGEKVTPESLAAHFAELGMGRQKVPELLEFVTELPYGGLQKARRDELRKLYRDRHPKGP